MRCLPMNPAAGFCGPAATGAHKTAAAVRAVPDQPEDLIPGIEWEVVDAFPLTPSAPAIY